MKYKVLHVFYIILFVYYSLVGWFTPVRGCISQRYKSPDIFDLLIYGLIPITAVVLSAVAIKQNRKSKKLIVGMGILFLVMVFLSGIFDFRYPDTMAVGFICE